MPTRQAASPPTLPGFTFLEHLGSGGYADVFLYEQAVPTRQVAVKVLDSAVSPGDAGRRMFAAEANLMAKVSAHPYIVQVFQADVAPDGRPFLVMEYYPGVNYYERARSEQLSIDEVLRVGVQLASAVETAHTAGVLHRDIKPANVLTSQYRRPGLTDFGIASAAGPVAETVDGVDGVSIPWSPPEALGEQSTDRRSDVYSLAATLYTLLAGRAPFEVRGGDNRPLPMMMRIEREPLPPTGRSDVPPSLERALARAMSKQPNHRPASAAEFGRDLQAVEAELRFAVTPLELADDRSVVRTRSADGDDDSTRVKGITEIKAQPGMIADVPERPVASGTATMAPRARQGMLAEPEVSDTVVRPTALTQSEDVEAERSSKLPVIAAIVAVAVAVIAGATFLVGGGGGGEDESENTLGAADVNDGIGGPVAVGPSPLDEVTGVANGDGTFAFTWAEADSDATYAVTEDSSPESERVSTTSYVAQTQCIDVAVVASDGQMSDPTRGCAS